MQNDYRANMGRGLESLILSSQGSVVLTKIPTSTKFIRGSWMPVSGPVDFFGGHVGTGKMLVFDAKQSKELYRLPTRAKCLKEHQRLEICRYGQAGFIAGLLCEQTTRSELYWCAWTLISRPTPSVPWVSMFAIGSSKLAVDWDRLVRMATERRADVG